MPKANVYHTISGQGTAVSTLDHLATTPRAKMAHIINTEGGIHCSPHVGMGCGCSDLTTHRSGGSV